MSNKKLLKRMLALSLSAAMTWSGAGLVYANSRALPSGRITSQDGTRYLTDVQGKNYSGWFIDSNGDWYYFNESDKSMKTGWHHDDRDGYWYYLNLSDGKMATGWQIINGKEYFFQPVRDMGNYHFNTEQEKWLYSMNSKVPYGAMYVSTTTPDGFKVDVNGEKIIEKAVAQTGNNTMSSETQPVKNGWVSESRSRHYYENGILAKDKWLNVGGKWYYVLSDGALICNAWKEIGGKSYYFGDDGAMLVNTTTPDGAQVDDSGARLEEESNDNFMEQNYTGDNCISRMSWSDVVFLVKNRQLEHVVKNNGHNCLASGCTINMTTTGNTADKIIPVQILGFNHDRIANSAEKAFVTFGTKNLINKQEYVWTGESEGYVHTTYYRIQNVLNNIYEEINDGVLKDAIVVGIEKDTVQADGKLFYGGYRSDISKENFKLTTSSDNILFLFSGMELTGGYFRSLEGICTKKDRDSGFSYANFEGEGKQYEYYRQFGIDLTTDSFREYFIKTRKGEPGLWWLRGACAEFEDTAIQISSSGDMTQSGTTGDEAGLCFGFCLN